MITSVTRTSIVKWHWWLTLGLGVVLSLRLTYVFLLPNTIDNWRDGLSYDDIARNLISGVGYWDKSDAWRLTTSRVWSGIPPFADPAAPTARWMPCYPFFVA